jgi:hypothetical protein
MFLLSRPELKTTTSNNCSEKKLRNQPKSGGAKPDAVLTDSLSSQGLGLVIET